MGIMFPSGFKLPAATQEPEHGDSAELGQGQSSLFWYVKRSSQCTDRYKALLLRLPRHSLSLSHVWPGHLFILC